MLRKISGEWRNYQTRDGWRDERRFSGDKEIGYTSYGIPALVIAKVEVLGLAIERVGKTTSIRVYTHQGVSCRLSLKNKAQPLTDHGERFPVGLVLLFGEAVLGLRSKDLHSQDSPLLKWRGLVHSRHNYQEGRYEIRDHKIY